MAFRETIARGWVTIGVPGTAHPSPATYVTYDAEQLPVLPAPVLIGDGLDWLRQLPEVGSGMTPDEYGYVTTPLAPDGVKALLGAADSAPAFPQLPADLRALISEPDLHRRLFSATDAYIDAGQLLEPVPGGHLLHLVSDSQWVRHWLAFIADDGGTGVVCADEGLGYVLNEEDLAARAGDPIEIVWVANTVAEFVWRWWADNYAFAQANPGLCPRLTAPDWFDPAEYASGYGPARL